MFALYVRQKKVTFEIQILPTIKFSLHMPINLLSLKNWEAVTRLMVCVSLCAIRKCPYISILQWFVGLLQAFFLP